MKGGLWFFVSFRIFFSDNTRVRIFIFFVAQSANFFPEFNFRLYDKNSESDYFFFLHQNQNIFFSNIGNQNIFFRKKPFKLNGRSLIWIFYFYIGNFTCYYNQWYEKQYMYIYLIFPSCDISDWIKFILPFMVSNFTQKYLTLTHKLWKWPFAWYFNIKSAVVCLPTDRQMIIFEMI